MTKQGWWQRAMGRWFVRSDAENRVRSKFRPTLYQFEERCLLSVTIPGTIWPLSEMVAGPSGDVWFRQVFNGGLGHVTSTGALTQFVSDLDPSTPQDLEVDGFGNLWYYVNTLAPGPYLERLTGAGQFLPVSNFASAAPSVSALTTPPAGYLPHVLFTYFGTEELIGVNADGSSSFVTLPSAASAGVSRTPNGAVPIVQGPDGAFWYPDGDGIGRVTATGFFRHYPLPGGNHDSVSTIALGPDGNLWFVEMKSTNSVWFADKIGRITTAGSIADVSLASVGSNLTIANFVTGTDGSIWFNEQGTLANGVNFQGNTHRIGRINANGTVTYKIAPNDDTVYKVTAVAPDGSLWTTTPAEFFQSSSQTTTLSQVFQSAMTADTSITLTVPAPATSYPTANADAYSVTNGQTLTAAVPGVLANDTGAQGMSAVLASAPANGALTFNADGSFSYTPAAGFTGSDSFSYIATAGHGDSNVATVSLTVAVPAPVPQADWYAILPGGTLQILAPGVLGNDTDPLGRALSAAPGTGAAHGSVTLNADGSFTYTASNGTVSSGQTTVTVDVGTVPVARDDSYTVLHDRSATLALLANDTDSLGGYREAYLKSGASHGSLFPEPDGSYLYTPAARYTGPDSFTYQVGDGVGPNMVWSGVATVTLNVIDNPPVAVNSSYTLYENQGINVWAPGLLAGASDPDGDKLSADITSYPTHGELEFDSDGQFLYTPQKGYYGSDQFSYRVGDGILWSSPATGTITVIRVDTPPVGSDLSVTTTQGTAVTTTLPVADPDGDPLSITVVTAPAHGTLTFNGGSTPHYTGDQVSGGSAFTYTPTSTFTGTDTFVYSPTDGVTIAPVYTVTLTVNAGSGGGGGSGGNTLVSNGTNGANGQNGSSGVIGSSHDLKTGLTLVYVDALPADFGPDAQARIDEAVAQLGADLRQFDVFLVEVFGASAAPVAQVHLRFADTTSLGGAAQGILGVTQDQNITILNGWNWYVGSDPTGIGAQQYDLETVVMHELGHTLGLAHSPDPSSVMYFSLGAGEVKRQPSNKDLILIHDIDMAPEPLMGRSIFVDQMPTTLPQASPAHDALATAPRGTADAATRLLVLPTTLLAGAGSSAQQSGPTAPTISVLGTSVFQSNSFGLVGDTKSSAQVISAVSDLLIGSIGSGQTTDNDEQAQAFRMDEETFNLEPLKALLEKPAAAQAYVRIRERGEYSGSAASDRNSSFITSEPAISAEEFLQDVQTPFGNLSPLVERAETTEIGEDDAPIVPARTNDGLDKCVLGASVVFFMTGLVQPPRPEHRRQQLVP